MCAFLTVRLSSICWVTAQVRAFSQEEAEVGRYHGKLGTAASLRASYFAALGLYMGVFHWALGLGM